MSDDIELQSFDTKISKESDSDEYHEISQDIIEEKARTVNMPPISEFDFFTQYETKKVKQKFKKKKAKNKKPQDLIDIIKTEMALEPFLITNSINILDYNNEVDKYLKEPCLVTLAEKGSRSMDAEHGYCKKTFENISPIFPSVLENASTKASNTVQIQYMKPVLFTDIIHQHMENDVRKTSRFLNVILRNIHFKHHHDFSLEKLLTVKLTSIYHEYKFVNETIKELTKHVEINRRTRNNIKEQLLKISPSSKDDVRFDKTVLKYTKLMLDFKEKYFQMLKIEKELAHKLTSIWADIKFVREKTGHIITNYIMELNEITAYEDNFQSEWNYVFEGEYSDLIVKIEYEYILKYFEYKKLKNGDIGAGDRISKPKLKIDYDKLKSEVENTVNEILPKNKFEVILRQDPNSITHGYSKDISINSILYFKLYVDNSFVCESEVYERKSYQWDIDFEECLSIEILPENSSLVIVLYENDECVSSIHINIPDLKKNTNETNFSTKEFMYNNVIQPSGKSVGSGYDIKYICSKYKARLKSSDMFKGELFSKCDVDIKLGWNERLNNNEIESLKSSIDTGRKLKRLLSSRDQPNINVVAEVINTLYDRKVEDDENIMNNLKAACERSMKILVDKNTFVDDGIDIPRYKLLYLRHNGVFSGIQNKVIPLFPTQISTEQLNCLQKSEVSEMEYFIFKGNSETDAIDLQRYVGMKYIENLNTNLLKNINECLLRKTYKDVVKDIGDLNLRSPPVAISNQQPQLLKQECLKEQEIHITVLRAFNLFDRSAALVTEENSIDEDVAGFKVHPLRPFVRASYHGVSVRTPTAIGCYPTWNHTVKINTELEPLSSIHINIYDECKDNTNDFSEDQYTQSTVFYRKVNKWLGTLEVPLHTVLNFGSIRGAFKITTPSFVFGYENVIQKDSLSHLPEVSQLFKKTTSFIVLQISTSLSRFGGFKSYYQPIPSDHQDGIIRHVNEFVTEYINDFPTRNISLTFIDSSGKNKCASEFLQPIPLPHCDFFPINPKHAESALSKSSGHSKSSSRSSKKKSSITEESLSGFEVPKSEANQFLKNMEAAVRYVSLIPTYEVSENRVVTLMGVELLKVLYGSPSDHTMLLASYFMYLGIKCWVVVGFGLPRGLCSYVLLKYQNNTIVMADTEEKRGFLIKTDDVKWYIYDAVAGERFDVRDVECPLKTVSHVFDCYNIWTNVQATEDCESVSLDFSKSSNWRVVFDRPLGLARSLAVDSLYGEPGDVDNIRTNIETKIRNKIQKWRSRVKTIWNSGLLKETLAHFEYGAFSPSEPRPTVGHRLKQLMATYKIFGFPLNMPYLNTKSIISNIKSTAIYMNDDPNVEFGLAVEVYSYPNNVISVWVFLVSITRI